MIRLQDFWAAWLEVLREVKDNEAKLSENLRPLVCH